MGRGFEAPYNRFNCRAKFRGKVIIYVLLHSIFSLSLSVATGLSQTTFLGTCDTPQESERHFRLTVPIYLRDKPSITQLSRLPSCLDVGNCELLASPVEDCRDREHMPYQGCDNVVSCSNGSTLLHPGLYAAVSLSSCTPSPVKGQAIRTCDDVVVVEEVWNQIAGGNCSSVCSPRLGSGQGYGKSGNCKSMLLELRTNSLLTALKLRTALKSTSSVGLLERCLGGAPELPTVQAVGPAEVDQVIGSAGDGTLAASPWGPCTASCGKGWQERSLVCATAPALLGELWECNKPLNAVVSRHCGEDACKGAQLLYQTPRTCSASCGGGIATQNVTCKAMGYGEDGCTFSEARGADLSCNAFDCELYVWNVGMWSACSATCDGGVMKRAVACLDSAGTTVDAKLCKGPQPITTSICNPKPCPGHCLKAGCGECEKGFVGNYCEVPDSCVSDVVSIDGQCCGSGVVNISGACCPHNSVLDRAGMCCPRGQVDACGVCLGDGKLVDVRGACCASGIVDARGACCASGSVDECGVCEGLSNTCALNLQMHADFHGYPFSARTPPDALTQVKYQAQLKEGIRNILGTSEIYLKLGQIEALADGSGGSRINGSLLVTPTPDAVLPLTAAAVNRLEALSGKRFSAGPNQTYALHLDYAGRTGVCGNGVCEVGERSIVGGRPGTCDADCPIPYVACPSGGSEADATTCTGAGRCLSNIGMCDCFEGYAGVACEQCAPGWIPSAGICIPYTPLLMLGTLTIPSPPPGYPAIPLVAVPSLASTPEPANQPGTPYKAILDLPTPTLYLHHTMAPLPMMPLLLQNPMSKSVDGAAPSGNQNEKSTDSSGSHVRFPAGDSSAFNSLSPNPSSKNATPLAYPMTVSTEGLVRSPLDHGLQNDTFTVPALAPVPRGSAPQPRVPTGSANHPIGSPGVLDVPDSRLRSLPLLPSERALASGRVRVNKGNPDEIPMLGTFTESQKRSGAGALPLWAAVNEPDSSYNIAASAPVIIPAPQVAPEHLGKAEAGVDGSVPVLPQATKDDYRASSSRKDTEWAESSGMDGADISHQSQSIKDSLPGQNSSGSAFGDSSTWQVGIPPSAAEAEAAMLGKEVEDDRTASYRSTPGREIVAAQAEGSFAPSSWGEERSTNSSQAEPKSPQTRLPIYPKLSDRSTSEHIAIAPEYTLAPVAAAPLAPHISTTTEQNGPSAAEHADPTVAKPSFRSNLSRESQHVDAWAPSMVSAVRRASGASGPRARPVDTESPASADEWKPSYRSTPSQEPFFQRAGSPGAYVYGDNSGTSETGLTGNSKLQEGRKGMPDNFGTELDRVSDRTLTLTLVPALPSGVPGLASDEAVASAPTPAAYLDSTGQPSLSKNNTNRMWESMFPDHLPEHMPHNSHAPAKQNISLLSPSETPVNSQEEFWPVPDNTMLQSAPFGIRIWKEKDLAPSPSADSLMLVADSDTSSEGSALQADMAPLSQTGSFLDDAGESRPPLVPEPSEMAHGGFQEAHPPLPEESTMGYLWNKAKWADPAMAHAGQAAPEPAIWRPDDAAAPSMEDQPRTRSNPEAHGISPRASLGVLRSAVPPLEALGQVVVQVQGSHDSVMAPVGMVLPLTTPVLFHSLAPVGTTGAPSSESFPRSSHEVTPPDTIAGNHLEQSERFQAPAESPSTAASHWQSLEIIDAVRHNLTASQDEASKAQWSAASPEDKGLGFPLWPGSPHTHQLALSFGNSELPVDAGAASPWGMPRSAGVSVDEPSSTPAAGPSLQLIGPEVELSWPSTSSLSPSSAPFPSKEAAFLEGPPPFSDAYTTPAIEPLNDAAPEDSMVSAVPNASTAGTQEPLIAAAAQAISGAAAPERSIRIPALARSSNYAEFADSSTAPQGDIDATNFTTASSEAPGESFLGISDIFGNPRNVAAPPQLVHSVAGMAMAGDHNLEISSPTTELGGGQAPLAPTQEHVSSSTSELQTPLGPSGVAAGPLDTSASAIFFAPEGSVEASVGAAPNGSGVGKPAASPLDAVSGSAPVTEPGASASAVLSQSDRAFSSTLSAIWPEDIILLGGKATAPFDDGAASPAEVAGTVVSGIEHPESWPYPADMESPSQGFIQETYTSDLPSSMEATAQYSGNVQVQPQDGQTTYNGSEQLNASSKLRSMADVPAPEETPESSMANALAAASAPGAAMLGAGVLNEVSLTPNPSASMSRASSMVISAPSSPPFISKPPGITSPGEGYPRGPGMAFSNPSEGEIVSESQQPSWPDPEQLGAPSREQVLAAAASRASDTLILSPHAGSISIAPSSYLPIAAPASSSGADLHGRIVRGVTNMEASSPAPSNAASLHIGLMADAIAAAFYPPSAGMPSEAPEQAHQDDEGMNLAAAGPSVPLNDAESPVQPSLNSSAAQPETSTAAPPMEAFFKPVTSSPLGSIVRSAPAPIIAGGPSLGLPATDLVFMPTENALSNEANHAAGATSPLGSAPAGSQYMAQIMPATLDDLVPDASAAAPKVPSSALITGVMIEAADVTHEVSRSAPIPEVPVTDVMIEEPAAVPEVSSGAPISEVMIKAAAAPEVSSSTPMSEVMVEAAAPLAGNTSMSMLDYDFPDLSSTGVHENVSSVEDEVIPSSPPAISQESVESPGSLDEKPIATGEGIHAPSVPLAAPETALAAPGSPMLSPDDGATTLIEAATPTTSLLLKDLGFANPHQEEDATAMAPFSITQAPTGTSVLLGPNPGLSAAPESLTFQEKELQHDLAAWMMELNAHEGFPNRPINASAGLHGLASWKSFATEGNPPDLSVTRERLYELLAQQELLRKIAALLGAKDISGNAAKPSGQDISDSIFEHTLGMGTHQLLIPGLGSELGSSSVPLPAPAISPEDHLSNTAYDAALPAAAPGDTRGALRLSSLSDEDYITPSSHLYSQSVSEHVPLFLSHLEQRPARGQGVTPDSVVQANTELLRRIAGAVGADNSSILTLTPGGTVSTADQVIKRVAAALSLGPGAPPPSVAAAPPSQVLTDNKIKALVFAAALEGLSTAGAANASSLNSSPTEPVLQSLGVELDSVSITQRVFNALAATPSNAEPPVSASSDIMAGNQGRHSTPNSGSLSAHRADDSPMPINEHAEVLSFKDVPGRSAMSTVSEHTKLGETDAALAMPARMTYTEGELWPGAQNATGGSKGLPKGVSRNLTGAASAPGAWNSTSGWVSTHDAPLQSFLQDAQNFEEPNQSPEVALPTSHQTESPAAAGPFPSLLPLVFSALRSSFATLAAAPQAAPPLAPLLLPGPLPSFGPAQVPGSMPLPLPQVLPFPPVSQGLAPWAGGPSILPAFTRPDVPGLAPRSATPFGSLDMAQEEQPSESTPGPMLVPSSRPAPAPGPNTGFAPMDAEMELPKGLVSVVLDLSGTSTREFSDSQNRFIAAVAKAAVTSPAYVRVVSTRARPVRRHLLQASSAIEVETHVYTAEPDDTYTALERNKQQLASELGAMGLHMLSFQASVLNDEMGGAKSGADTTWAAGRPSLQPSAPAPLSQDASSLGRTFPAFARQSQTEVTNGTVTALGEASSWISNNATAFLGMVLAGSAVSVLGLALAVYCLRRRRNRHQAQVALLSRHMSSSPTRGAEIARVAAEVVAATIPVRAAAGVHSTAHLGSEAQRPSPLSLRTKFSRQKPQYSGAPQHVAKAAGTDVCEKQTMTSGRATGSMRTSSSSGFADVSSGLHFDAGFVRSLSDTDSMPAKLPAFIPRSSTVLEADEGGLNEDAAAEILDQISQIPISRMHSGAATPLKTQPAPDEGALMLPPISNTNFVGVSSAFYNRMLAKSERAVVQSQGVLEAASRIVQAGEPISISSDPRHFSQSDRSTEEDTIASSGLCSSSTTDVRSTRESMHEIALPPAMAMPPTPSEPETLHPSRPHPLTPGGVSAKDRGTVETPERMSVKDLLQQTEARLAAFRSDLSGSPEIAPCHSLSPGIPQRTSPSINDGPKQVARALFINATTAAGVPFRSSSPAEQAPSEVAQHTLRYPQGPNSGDGVFLHQHTIQHRLSTGEESSEDSDSNSRHIEMERVPVPAAARLRLAADALALHLPADLEWPPDSAFPSSFSHDASAPTLQQATIEGPLTGIPLEENRGNRPAAANDRRNTYCIPAYRPEKILLASPGNQPCQSRVIREICSKEDIEVKAIFSEPNQLKKRIQVTMMHQYNAETVGQWLHNEKAGDLENMDCRWLPPPPRSSS